MKKLILLGLFFVMIISPGNFTLANSTQHANYVEKQDNETITLVNPPLPSRKFRWLLFLEEKTPNFKSALYIYLNDFDIVRFHRSKDKYNYRLVIKSDYQIFDDSSGIPREFNSLASDDPPNLPNLFLYSKTASGDFVGKFGYQTFLKIKAPKPDPNTSKKIEKGEVVTKKELTNKTTEVFIIFIKPAPAVRK